MDSNSHNQPSDLFSFQHNLPHTDKAIIDQLWFLPNTHTCTWINHRTHYIPPYCPSALIFFTPPRGIGWDCTAVECSPLPQGSKCSGAKGKESNNKITGFVTPDLLGGQLFVFVSTWTGSGKERSLRKATEVAIRRKSPEALTQRNGELLPLVTLFFDHMSLKWINNTFKTTCPFPFTLPLDKEQASAPVEENPRTFKSRHSIRQPTPFLFYCLSSQ